MSVDLDLKIAGGDSCCISSSTVNGYVGRAKVAKLTWPLPDELDDAALSGAVPLRERTGLEVRKGYPLRRKSSADPPRRRVRGGLEATVVHLDGVRQLPVVGLRRAA